MNKFISEFGHKRSKKRNLYSKNQFSLISIINGKTLVNFIARSSSIIQNYLNNYSLQDYLQENRLFSTNQIQSPLHQSPGFHLQKYFRDRIVTTKINHWKIKQELLPLELEKIIKTHYLMSIKIKMQKILDLLKA